MTAPPYPNESKVLSSNFTVAGTQFAIADEDEDTLEPEDIWRHARATEEHTHDDDRGLPVRRVDAVSAPSATGHVQVNGDDFRWWGDLSGAVMSAVVNGTDQTVDGVKRFVDPLLLPRQVTDPPAPGTGLGYLYLGPSDRLYLRSGSNPPAPVGTPGTVVPPLAWYTTQGAGQALQQQLALTAPTWVLTYRPAGNDYASLTTVVPYTYGSTPITFHVTWTCGPGTGKVNFDLIAKVVAPGASLTAAGTSVAEVTVNAPDTNLMHQRATISWTTGLPAPGDVVFLALKRDHTKEAAAGPAFAAQVFVVDTALVFG
jgi:mRNA-degrading endonuclease toxin of MazEF toxin-antitoxin module